MRDRSKLRDKQRIIVDYLLQDRCKLVVAAMGSGKTGAVLTALRELLDSFQVKHVLVIAPKLVALRTWPDEIETWEHTACLSYAVAVGTEKVRVAAIDARCEITTINFESLQWLAKHLGTIDNWHWDCVIIDESSRMKAGKKRTSRARVKVKVGSKWSVGDHVFPDRRSAQDYADLENTIRELVGEPLVDIAHAGDVFETKVRKGGKMTRFGILSIAQKKISRIYELTGTPTPLGVQDLWGQIYLLDRGERLGRSMTAFETKWFDKNKYTHQIKIKDGAKAQILNAVDDIMVTIPADKLVDEPIFIPVKVDLPPKALREYREFEKTLYSEPYDVEAVSKGVLSNKLLQFANGSMYKADRTVVPIHTAKMDALDELVAQAGDDNLLIFYGFKFDRDAIKKKYPHAVVANEDDDSVRKWNTGEIKMLLAHPASIGHGLNLQYGGHIAIWYGLTNNLEYYQQANARLPRPGQERQVLIYLIMANDTDDDGALGSLSAKGANQESIKDRMLHHMEKFA